MHFAWVIVGFVFTSQFIANALGFYAFGVMLAPIAEEFGASRAGVGMIPFGMSWAGALLGPALGRAVALYPIRNLMALGASVMACGFYVMSFATELWQLVAGYALAVALGINCTSGIVPSALIVNWFEERRAFAMGVAAVGVSLAGFVMTPITSAWVESVGWRGTFRIFAGISAAIVPIAWFFATTHPRERGLLPFGASSQGDGATQGPQSTLGTREALATPELWLIATAAGISFMVTTAIITHIVTLGTDAGLEPVRAAFLLSAIAGAGAVAKILFGALAERIGERAAFVVAFACQMAGVAGVAAFQSNYAPLVAAAALFGLGMGGVLPLQMALLARVFGPANFGPAAGLAGPILVVFQSLGAPALGYAYDLQGRYDEGLWALCGLLLLPIAAILAVRERGAAEAETASAA